MSYLHFLTPMPLADEMRHEPLPPPPTAPLQAMPGYGDPIHRTAPGLKLPSRVVDAGVDARTDS